MTKFKKDRAIVRDMARTPSRASMRLVLLLRQLEEKYGGTRGARAAIARKTKLDPAVVSDFLNGKRDNVKGEIIDRVCDRMGIDQRFFVEPWPEGVVKHYTEFPAPRRLGVDAIPLTPVPPGNAGDADEDDDDDLRDLAPSATEIAAWAKHLRRFRYPKVTSSMKRAFIAGMRERRVQDAMDDAVNKLGDDFANKRRDR